MIEYTPLQPHEIALLEQKEARGELTPEDCKRFIESTRAKFLSRPTKEPKAAKAKGPQKDSVDFF